tara:strand:- start:247 stop:624 length:378 start_codon:yes stop_codon:yes gene_type:complete
MNKLLTIILLVTLITLPSYAQEKNSKEIGNLNLVIGNNKVSKSNFGGLDVSKDGKLRKDKLDVEKKDMEKKKLKSPVFKTDENKSPKKSRQNSRMKSSKSSGGKKSGRSGGRSKGGRSGGKGGGY